MVKDSVDLLELLRKTGVEGDVDSLLEALRVVAETARAILPARWLWMRPYSCWRASFRANWASLGVILPDLPKGYKRSRKKSLEVTVKKY